MTDLGVTSLEDLIQLEFGVPYGVPEACVVVGDDRGVAGHVGVSRRAVLWPGGDRCQTVAGVEFLVVRRDRRGRGVARGLMQLAHYQAAAWGLSTIVLFSDLEEFYRQFGYVPMGRGALARGLWPAGLEEEWEPVGGPW